MLNIKLVAIVAVAAGLAIWAGVAGLAAHGGARGRVIAGGRRDARVQAVARAQGALNRSSWACLLPRRELCPSRHAGESQGRRAKGGAAVRPGGKLRLAFVPALLDSS
jgi:hypothetical protein